MALVRVYCGLASADPPSRPASAGSWLTVAVVDDAGRLLDVCEISDDPAGYARLGALLAERSSGPTAVAVASDSDDHLVMMLLGAAGRPLAFADADSADDYAERFADDESLEELESPQAERRAVGLARALQAGALSAVALAAPRDLVAFKPILAAHAALATGRQSAAVALREVLRELYPAALRAYPDPAEPIALAVLDVLPEPGLLGAPTAARGRDVAVAADAAVAQLTQDGVADPATIAEAVTALRVAIAETPRRGGVNKALAAAAAEAVRHAVAAVRACDAAGTALVATLTERPSAPPVPSPTRRVPARRPIGGPPSAPPASTLHPVPVAADHMDGTAGSPQRARPHPAAGSTPVIPQPVAPPPVAPAPMSPPPAVPVPMSPPPVVPAPPPVAPAAAAQASMPPSAAHAYAPPGHRDPASPAGSVYGMPPASHSVSQEPVPAHPVSGHPATGHASAPAGSTMVPPIDPLGVPAAPPRRGAHAAPPAAAGPNRPVSAPPPPPPGITPIIPMQRGPIAPAEGGEPFRPTLTTAALSSARAARSAHRPAEPPNVEETGGNDYRPTDITVHFPAPRPSAAPGSRANWPLVGPADDPSTGSDRSSDYDFERPPSELNRPAEPAETAGRVTPPWLADDLPEPPTLRLVEPPPLADRALRDELTPLDDLRYGPPPLRLVESESADHSGGGRSRRGHGAERAFAPPVPDEDDGDLLIFAAARSAWFTGHAEREDELEWASSADTGWLAAERVAQPAVGDDTRAGLPRRVPQANLVPGSPLRDERPLRIVRDAASIAAHTTGYFRGWRRGQEIGGYAVGGRPGRDSAGGWDFSRDQEMRQHDEREYEYRSAGYRS
ncbi:MAG TPA: transposase [Micromonosporaceae bacterium]